MLKSVVALAAIVLTAQAAIAETSKGEGISEFHHHAMGGEVEITPSVDYTMMNAKPRSSVFFTKAKINNTDISVKGEYGVAPRLGVGAIVGMTSGTQKTEPTGSSVDKKTSGLNDLTLFGHGSSEMGNARLAYGLDLGVSLGKQTTNAANSKVDAQTGGMSLMPAVGYEMAAGPGTFGVHADYAWPMERTHTRNGTETKVTGGSDLGLAAFYEMMWSAENSVGASFRYDMSGETENNVAGVKTKQADKFNMWTLSVYAPSVVANNITLIPRIDYGSRSYSQTTSTIKTMDIINVGLALRWQM